ncbi:antibiotic biosynthesis monooxygenase family protein [Paenibacillus sp. 481]|uniref:antibiotic biosynthesis monooxygenase family protein n=1 Tax=Paenibacillus sp. 481 TaxID=2835869 RepID=UPI001E328F3A|nr:antibiotic biosynthesis monooxygenase [Paenibacillus sp. 481]UHA72185.1 antibiotic biosynthesis monooxygenase [Paenibacillus sp. 481]
MSQMAKTPQPPYYAVIFCSSRSMEDEHEQTNYGEMATKMVELAAQQPGFLGVESSRDRSGFGITVSYWESHEAIAGWKRNTEHQLAQKYGRDIWYSEFATRVCKVERDYFKS